MKCGERSEQEIINPSKFTINTATKNNKFSSYSQEKKAPSPTGRNLNKSYSLLSAHIKVLRNRLLPLALTPFVR